MLVALLSSRARAYFHCIVEVIELEERKSAGGSESSQGKGIILGIR